jgi:hypothetical protein
VNVAVARIVTWAGTPDRGVETADNGPAVADSVVVVDEVGATISLGSASCVHNVPVSLATFNPELAGHAVLLFGLAEVPPGR